MKRKSSLGAAKMPAQFDSSLEGLTHQVAQQLLHSKGRNTLPEAQTRGFWKILFNVLKEPMLVLLLGCGGIYYVLGEPQEALVLLGFVFIVILITLFQEVKSERALEALRDLSSPKSWVIRDGIKVKIDSRDIVPGDLMMIAEGDRICADATLIQGTHLSVDESLLTGESVPVRKTDWQPGAERHSPGGDDQPHVYSGTLVVSGHGLVRVTGTGMATELGKIGISLNAIQESRTALQVETGLWVGRLALLGAALCLTVTISLGLMHHDWLGGILSGLTLAMAVLPEEFPVVLTIFLAMGAFRLSRVKVLTRRNHAIETLGSANVICTDKTGTLTENRMQLQSLCINGQYVERALHEQGIPESHHILLETALLASQRDPFEPMERELFAVGRMHAADHVHESWRLEKQYPLTPDLLAMSCVWTAEVGHQGFVVATKGAPEAVMELCHLSSAQIGAIRRDINHMAEKGLRVLGVARTLSQDLPIIQHDFPFEFVGLIGFMDPIREQVPAAIKLCHSAGIRIVMITGDYPITAQQIGRQIGLEEGKIVTGEALERMTDKALQAALPSISIFARVVPEQKLRIIQRLQARGDIVAMTGDGVNDAPALKAANIGIAMGQRGTDVAREAADLVLLNDAFDAIVEGIRMGRRIFDNLRKAMAYIIAVHLPIAGISLLPLILESVTHRVWPNVLMPIHIVFLELIIDPACTVVFEVEPDEKGIMKRAPRIPGAPLFNSHLLFLSIVQGCMALLTTGSLYSYAVMSGMAEDAVRSVTFASLVFGNLALLWVNRSWFDSLIHSLRIKNNALWWVMGGTLLTLGLSIYIPSVRALFHFETPSDQGLLLALAGAPLSVFWFEIYKAIVRHRFHKPRAKPRETVKSKPPKRSAGKGKRRHRLRR
jgi:Ca2+-transporting ATPase